MTNRSFWFPVLLSSLLMSVAFIQATRSADGQSAPATSAVGSTQQPTDLRGTWSGTFFSKHSNVAPFTMTVVINADSSGHLTGSSTLSSECLKAANLAVTVTGAKVVLAGSDQEGDNITVRGTVDSTGTILKAKYILNGSATGRCETVDGTGTLAKR